MIDAGKRDKRITIETSTAVQAASGETQSTWATFTRVWASRDYASGSEIWRAQQVNPLLSDVWKMNWVKGVMPKMRVRWDDPEEKRTRYFGIDTAMADKRKNELILHCIEDVDG